MPFQDPDIGELAGEGDCDWDVNADAAVNIHIGSQGSGDGLEDVNTPRVYERKFCCNGTFLANSVAMGLVYQGILDKCKTYGITSQELHDVIGSEPRIAKPSKLNYKQFSPNFCYLPEERVRKTFEVTSQNMNMPPPTFLRKYHRSRNPAQNVYCRDEADSIDQIFSDTPSIDGGEKSAVIITGVKSHITACYKTKGSTEEDILGAFQDHVRQYGRPRKLYADAARVYQGNCFVQYLRDLYIGFWSAESKHQNQNPVERRYETVKRMTNRLMERRGAPAIAWFFAMSLVCYTLSHAFDLTLPGKKSPMMYISNAHYDISPLLQYQFWEPVYVLVDSPKFPSESTRVRGHWLGIDETISHQLCFLVYIDSTKSVVSRSEISSALDPEVANKREDPITINIPHKDSAVKNETYVHSPNCRSEHDAVSSVKDVFEKHKVILKDKNGKPRLDAKGEPMEVIVPHPDDLQGRTFLTEPDPVTGTTQRLRIVEAIDRQESERKQDPSLVKFRILYEKEDEEDVMTYNQILNYIEREDHSDEGTFWKFRKILAHQHTPFGHPDRKGSEYNIKMEWETGEVTYEPLGLIAADSPIECAMYAKDNNLLDKVGWRQFRNLVKNEKKMLRMAKQTRLRSYRSSPKYMFGFRIPRNYQEAKLLDEQNGNRRWKEATDYEMAQLRAYDIWIDKGKYHRSKIPAGYRQITCHLIYACKHDGRFKARMVCRGDLTDPPLESIYSGVISLRGFRTLLFLSELNDLPAWATDISNAYLEATTREKVCIRAGPEFGDLHDHLLIIFKALYGLRSSGKEFNVLLAEILKKMDFERSKSESEIWMRKCPTRDCYEYIGTWVDDLCLVLANPEAFIAELESEPFNLKFKGTGPISYNLGMGVSRDQHDTLCVDSLKYVDRMEEAYSRVFDEEKPNKKYISALVPGDHPELDSSPFLDEEWTQRYQSLVGAVQWAVSIGRMDINVAIMSMSSFQVQPRQGHLDRIKRMYGYLSRFRNLKIRIRTEEPDYSHIPLKQHNWSNTQYGSPTEDIPHDAPTPRGKRITITVYFDANLMHNVMTGKAVTGILIFYNRTPMEWFCKQQATAETATYGAEFCSGRTGIEKLVDHRNSLRYLGVPINIVSYVFGDNESMINSSTIPHARLNKTHNILSYHFVRSMVACGYINMQHVKSEYNFADFLSKHWSYQSTYPWLIRPLTHHCGDTRDLLECDAPVYTQAEYDPNIHTHIQLGKNEGGY